MTAGVTRIPGRPTEFLGVPVERHAVVKSTNDEALRRAEAGAPEGLVVVAETQTAGRGRLGRSWFDRAGLSLPFSIVLRPSIPLPHYPLLALCMAGAVAEAGASLTGAALDVKWPNDVLHAGRKLCGILAESRSGESPALVIGAGINVNHAEEDFPDEIRERATSLRLAAGNRGIAVDDVLEEVLRRFAGAVALARNGDPAAIRADAIRRLPLPGTEIAVRTGGRVLRGVVAGYSETGALRLREPDREEATLVTAGETVSGETSSGETA
jgi:BirA family biotin operon repressor/biotin-[acetyl-CoA-carboxylase] ligase